jgi:hypothetical protein
LIRRLISALLFLVAGALAQTPPYNILNQPANSNRPYPAAFYNHQLPNAGAGGPLGNLMPGSAQMIQNVTGNFTNFQTGPYHTPGSDDFSSWPLYFGQASDPTWPVQGCSGNSYASGLNGQIVHMQPLLPYNGFTGGNSDSNFLLYDQVTGKLWVFYTFGAGQIPAVPGTFTHNGNSYCGMDVWNTGPGYQTGSTITGGTSPFGPIMRLQELLSGVINHALYGYSLCSGSGVPTGRYPGFTVFPIGSGGGSPGQLCTSKTSPASTDVNRPPNGSLFFLDYTTPQLNCFDPVQPSCPGIAKLGIIQYAILRAATLYGIIIGGTGNGDAVALPSIESETPYSWLQTHGYPGAQTVANNFSAAMNAQCIAPCTFTDRTGGGAPGGGACVGGPCVGTWPNPSAPHSTRQYNTAWWANVSLVNGLNVLQHFHIADPCVALGMEGLAGGCVGGLAPAVAFSPGSVNFGTVPVSTSSSPVVVALSNPGNAALTISGKAITGTNLGDFSQTNNCPASLAAAASCAFSITAKPTASGVRSAFLTLTDNAVGSPHQVALTVTGGTSTVSLNPAVLNFGTIAPGSCSAVQQTTLTNTGSTALTITNLGFTGTNPLDFPVGGTGSCPSLLASRTYTTNFPATENPISEGGNWINGGTTGLDWANVRTTPGLAFGTQTGSGALNDSTAVVGGSWNNDQTVTATVHTVSHVQSTFEELELRLRTTIAPHSIKGYEINFAVGPGQSYTQIVRWNGPLGSFTMLSNKAVGGAVVNGDVVKASITGSTITVFKNGIQVNTATDTTFASGFPGMGMFLQGANTQADYGFSTFTATGAGGGSLGPGSSCTQSAKFCPTATGSRTANMSFTDNAPGSPQTVPMSGVGGAAAMTLSPSSAACGNQQVGTSVLCQAFTLTASGSINSTGVTISLGGTNPTAYSQSNNCPSTGTITPAQSCTINAFFKPAAAGLLTSALSVASNGAPVGSTLTGTGTVPGTIQLAPSTVNFNDVLVGNFSPVTNVTATNTGTSPVTISGVSLIGANPGDFTAGECATAASGFTDNFDQGALSSKWQIDTGTAPGNIGGVNTSTFSTSNVDLSNGMLGLKVVQSGAAPTISVGAEVRSTTAFGFGSYRWSMRSASTATTPYLTGTVPSGQVSSDFILNSSISNPYTEIDSPEIEGRLPNTIEWTTWSTPSLNTATTATLANPELGFHVYGFKWTAPSVAFSIDGTLSQTHSTNIPFAPANPMMNLWGTNNAAFGGLATNGTRWQFVKAFSFTPAGVTTLAAGASCTIPVYFSPLSIGLKIAALSMADSATGSPHQASLSGTGTAPIASLAPVSHDFGSQVSGTQTAPFNFTWSNTGTGPMRWTLSLAGANPGDFVLLANSCANPLPGGQNCIIPAAFKPTTTGARAATLTLVNSASTTPSTAALTGTGVATAPAVCLSATSLSFPNTPVNSVSASLPVVVTNCGTASLVVSSVTPTGNFSQANACGTVTVGSTCTINVKFAPLSAGPLTGNISIASNAASSPNVVTLSGFGTQDGATLTPSSLSFGSITVGQVSANQAVTLQNTGNTSLALGGATINDPNFSFIFGNPTCNQNLAPQAQCQYFIRCNPIAAGAQSGTFTQPFTGTSISPLTVSLSCTGVATAPAVTLTPSSIDFGNVTVGVLSKVVSGQIQNTGTATLNLSSIALTGTNPGDYTLVNHCGLTLAPGAFCPVDVSVTPGGTGARTANVHVVDDASDSPQNLTLTVNGVAAPTPRISLAPTSLAFSPPSIQTGTTSAGLTVTATNTGNADLVIATPLTFGGANPTQFIESDNCGTVTAGNSCTATVNCQPTATGFLTATLIFASNAASSPDTATLSCTGFTGTPNIVLGISRIDFGNQTVGKTSNPLVFIVTNNGTATATGLAVTSTTADFAVTGACGSTLAVGAFCSEQATFTPSTLCGQFDSAGGCISNVHLGSISVVSNTVNSPQTIALQGTAIPVPPPPGPVKVTLGGVLVLGGHLVVGVQ